MRNQIPSSFYYEKIHYNEIEILNEDIERYTDNVELIIMQEKQKKKAIQKLKE